MDHLIGQRFSLISKSEIRYVGILHEINPEQSTIALEEVYSFGTEERRVDNFIPPSPQKFEYIVFRGSDVKDIKIAEDQQESKPPSQPPNDPAILNSSRPGPPQQPQAPPQPHQQGPPQGPSQGPPQNRGESPFLPPQNYPPPGQYGGFYPPPPPGQFGRGYGPPPGAFGPGPGFSPYGPPPGYYGPPGQHFQPGPPGPNRFPPQPPMPIGPLGSRQAQSASLQSSQPPATQPKQTPELPDAKTSSRSASKTSTPAPIAASAAVSAPAPPTAPTSSTAPESVQQSTKPIDIPQANPEIPQPLAAAKPPPTMPKSNRVTPAMPFTVNQKSFIPPAPQPIAATTTAQSSTKAAPSQAEMEEASRQAKDAVAAAMAKLNPQSAPKPAVAPTPTTVESLTERVNLLTTVPYVPSGPSGPRGRGTYRGGRGPRAPSGGQRQKMEIPQSDFDFESANAKFNKGDLIKEAIASGSPLQEYADTPFSDGLNSASNETNGARKDSISSAPMYNKSSSFFDNISSDSKDREDTQTGNGRAMRGQEFKKNIETFGQGNVDSGYRGRGRGRGGYRGRARGSDNGAGTFRGNYRGRARDTPDV